ncbi:MAG: type III pantothenate kinase [Erysipelotrichaceae bacterium]
MLLTIDIGNSNIVCVVYSDSKEKLYDARYETIKEDVKSAYRDFVLNQIYPLKDKYNLEAFIVSSVVPSVDQVFFEAVESSLNIKGYKCTTETVSEFEILLTNPQELGADFIATSYGAMCKYKTPIVVADLGSATKLSAINSKGQFAGGIIMPGLRISQDALNRFIPHLPTIPLDIPKSVLGIDTITAMQAGLMFSTIDSINGIAQRIENEFNEKCTRILTGGLSVLIKDHTESFIYEPFLLNEGLYEIYRKFVK